MATEMAKRMMAAFNRLGQTEQVVYRPSGGMPREVTAMVTRGVDQQFMANTACPLLTIELLNDAIDGVVAAKVNAGGDQIDVAVVVGGTRQTFNNVRLSQGKTDADWTALEVG